MDPNPYSELCLWFVLYSEGVHGAENRQGHESNLASVVITIPLGQTGNHHVRVTNRLDLQSLKSRAMLVEIKEVPEIKITEISYIYTK
jgi:hypothetical protein